MKIPVHPPDPNAVLTKIGFERYVQVITALQGLPLPSSYPHWDKLIHLPPPEGVTNDEWWCYLKNQRRPWYKHIDLKDRKMQPFRFLMTDPIPEELHHIDQGAGGRIGVGAPVINAETRDHYYISSLIEEAITSSQLEGAVTTRQVAKEMLLTQRAPVDRSERMILNNFLTMRHISALKDKQLSKELVFQVHKLITEGTLDDPSAAGRYRRADEDIVISDHEGTIYHVPPPADQLDGRMSAMCAFANGETPAFFVHPVIRAIILHFWLAYDHPFVDGNGRTSRALFYWKMLHSGYWLCEYVSISRIIKKARSQYERAFLYTETDENDLTYFILYHSDVMRRAIQDLDVYIKKKVAQQQGIERRMRGMLSFNSRQRALISHAIRHPNFQYTIEGHRTSHGTVYETARTDLQQLVKKNILTPYKIGRTWHYTPVPDMEERLQQTA